MRKITNNNHQIFSLIDAYNNDIWHQFNQPKLFQLCQSLNKYLLEYRSILDFPSELTFGTEIELIKYNNQKPINYQALEKLFSKRLHVAGYTCSEDSSLTNGGFEVQSPIMQNDIKTWHDFDKVLTLLQKIGYIDHSCGGHIHIGTQTLKDDLKVWRNFFLLWSTYEKIIIRFLDGEYLQHRSIDFTYDTPLSEDMWLTYELTKNTNTFLPDAINLLSATRYQIVNFHNITDLSKYQNHNTIEFRGPNGTLDPIIWQNNINLMLNLINTCLTDDKVDDERLFMRWINLQNTTIKGIINYNEIYLNQALEFCDLIFDNNLDKIYFLRQYLKNFSVNNNGYFKKVPTFTEELKQSNNIKKLTK